jgi:class 3 adenylate cyclase
MKNKIYLLIGLLLSFPGIKSQVNNNDSLWKIWFDSSLHDTVRLQAIDDLAWDVRYNNTDSALTWATLELEYAIAKGQKKWQAKAYNTLGVANYIKSNYAEALNFHQKSLEIKEQTGDKKGMASSYNNIGNIYSDQGNYAQSIAYSQKSIDLYEQMGNEHGLATSYNNLGGIYLAQCYFPKALEQFQKSLFIYEKLKDEKGMADAYNNIGILHDLQNNHLQALEYYKKCLNINEQLEDKKGIANAYINIGIIYRKENNYEQALDYFTKSRLLEQELANKQGMLNSDVNTGDTYALQNNFTEAYKYYRNALDICKELDNKDLTAYVYNSLGNLYLKQEDYFSAVVSCKKALEISRAIGVILYQRDACKCLYEANKILGNNDQALSFHEKFLLLDDSLKANETSKKLDQMEFAKIILTDSLKKEEEKLHVQIQHEKEIHEKNEQRNIFMYSGIGILVLAGALWSRLRYTRRSKALIQKEKDRSENLLLNILPVEIAEELKTNGRAEARDFEQVTILFTDFKEFTKMSEKMSAKDLVAEINFCFKAFDEIVDRYKIEKIKTIGDSYMAAGGLPVTSDNAVKNVVFAALEIQAFIKKRKIQKEADGVLGFEMRAGIHSGPVVAGIVGVKKFQYDIWGDTVNIASRMESAGVVGRVNISQSTYELLKNEPGFLFEGRGKIEVKGKVEIEMYFVELK